MIKLFKTGTGEKTTVWYISPFPVCDVCKAKIKDFNAIYIIDFSRKERTENLIHINCRKKYVRPVLSVTQNRFNVIITDTIPRKSVPMIVQNPTFKDFKDGVTVFEHEQIKTPINIDHAWRSKRYPSLEGVRVGDPDALIKIAAKDKETEKFYIGDADE